MSFATIEPRRLQELCAAGKTVELLDVRTPMEYREVHAQLARNLPLDQLDPAKVIGARNGAADEPLYIICRSGARGRQACEKFVAAGFTNVVNVEGGTQAWAEAGLPVVRGKKGVSLECQVRIVTGVMVVLGAALAWLHPAFALLAAFMGAGLIYSGVTDTCPMGTMLARMPWNRVKNASPRCGC